MLILFLFILQVNVVNINSARYYPLTSRIQYIQVYGDEHLIHFIVSKPCQRLFVLSYIVQYGGQC